MVYAEDRETCQHPAEDVQTKCYRCGQLWHPPTHATPDAPAPTLDLDAIEARVAAWLADPYWSVQPTRQLIATDLPALVARVRALETEVAELRAYKDRATPRVMPPPVLVFPDDYYEQP